MRWENILEDFEGGIASLFRKAKLLSLSKKPKLIMEISCIAAYYDAKRKETKARIRCDIRNAGEMPTTIRSFALEVKETPVSIKSYRNVFSGSGMDVAEKNAKETTSLPAILKIDETLPFLLEFSFSGTDLSKGEYDCFLVCKDGFGMDMKEKFEFYKGAIFSESETFPDMSKEGYDAC